MEPKWVILQTEDSINWKADGMVYIEELVAYELMVTRIRTNPKIRAACVRELKEPLPQEPHGH